MRVYKKAIMKDSYVSCWTFKMRSDFFGARKSLLLEDAQMSLMDKFHTFCQLANPEQLGIIIKAYPRFSPIGCSGLIGMPRRRDDWASVYYATSRRHVKENPGKLMDLIRSC